MPTQEQLSTTRFGVINSITASVLFAVMYFYATLLAPMDGAQIYGWRILVTLPFLTGLMLLTGRAQLIASVWRRALAQPALWLALLATSALLGVQLWLFMWAPVSGHALSVSLGYFLLPLTLAVTGRVVFKERLSRFQRLALLFAALGIANELIFAPAVSWPTFVVALGYPLYFVLRKRIGTNHLGGIWFDMALSLPVAIWFMGNPSVSAVGILPSAMHGVMILGLGILSAASLACMISASLQLSLGLFGLLSYVEPALLVVVALLIGERIDPSQWLTYLSIWAAILVLIVEGCRSLRQWPAKAAPVK